MEFFGIIRKTDLNGRIVIPIEIRKKLNIKPNDKLKIDICKPGLEIRVQKLDKFT